MKALTKTFIHLAYDPLHLICLEDVGAVADAVLYDEDENGDEWQDHHVHRVQPLTDPEIERYSSNQLISP